MAPAGGVAAVVLAGCSRRRELRVARCRRTGADRQAQRCIPKNGALAIFHVSAIERRSTGTHIEQGAAVGGAQRAVAEARRIDIQVAILRTRCAVVREHDVHPLARQSLEREAVVGVGGRLDLDAARRDAVDEQLHRRAHAVGHRCARSHDEALTGRLQAQRRVPQQVAAPVDDVLAIERRGATAQIHGRAGIGGPQRGAVDAHRLDVQVAVLAAHGGVVAEHHVDARTRCDGRVEREHMVGERRGFDFGGCHARAGDQHLHDRTHAAGNRAAGPHREAGAGGRCGGGLRIDVVDFDRRLDQWPGAQRLVRTRFCGCQRCRIVTLRRHFR